MSANFECGSCSLRFATGRDHYGLWMDGYVGRKNVFCSSCGTQHGVEEARADRGLPFEDIYQLEAIDWPESARPAVVRALNSLTQMGLDNARIAVTKPPLTLGNTHENYAQSMSEGLTKRGVTVRLHKVGERRNEGFGPIQRHRLRYLNGPLFRKNVVPSRWSCLEIERVQYIDDANLAAISCTHCLAPGALSQEFEDGDVCPACGHHDVACFEVYLSR